MNVKGNHGDEFNSPSLREFRNENNGNGFRGSYGGFQNVNRNNFQNRRNSVNSRVIGGNLRGNTGNFGNDRRGDGGGYMVFAVYLQDF